MVILPRKNEKDLRDVPEEIRKQIKLVLVDSMDEVLGAALRQKPKALEPSKPKVLDKGEEPAEAPEGESRVRRSNFPPAEQPPVVVQGTD
jgi:hypothetical protein